MRAKRITILSVLSIIVIIIVLSLSYYEGNFKESTESTTCWPDDGVYFAQWSSYHYYEENERPYLQFSLFYINRESSQMPDIKKCELISDNGEIYEAEQVLLQLNDPQIPCSLYNLSCFLPNLNKGEYVFDAILLSYEGEMEKVKYSIGIWEIEVGEQSSDEEESVEVGKHTFIDGILEDYRIELTNNTDKDIYLNDFTCKLNGEELRFTLFQAEEYSDIFECKSQTLPQKQSRTFCFKFLDVPPDIIFASIKPKITYVYENEVHTLSAPFAIYSPSLTNDQICTYLSDLTLE